jgi:hypothetical protein
MCLLVPVRLNAPTPLSDLAILIGAWLIELSWNSIGVRFHLSTQYFKRKVKLVDWLPAVSSLLV